MAMALFGLAVVVGPAAGPVLGGYIIDNLNWPWIFYINLPIGLLGIFMVTRFVHEPEDIRRANHDRAAEQRKNLDWLGMVLMTGGLASLQYVLEEGSRNDWFSSTAVAVCTIGGRAAAVGLRRARADRARAGRRPEPLQGQGLPVRHAHRRHDVRDPDVDHLPAAALHAGAAGVLGRAVGDGADAARAGDDGGDPDRGAPLQLRAAAHPRDAGRRAGRAQRVRDVALHAGHRRPLGRGRDHPAGRRLRAVVRPADDGGAGQHPALPTDGRHRAQLAAAPDRRLAGPGRVRDAAAALRAVGAGRARVTPHARPPGGHPARRHDPVRPGRARAEPGRGPGRRHARAGRADHAPGDAAGVRTDVRPGGGRVPLRHPLRLPVESARQHARAAKSTCTD